MNLAYCWFCGLGLEDREPHHSTFSVNRHGRFRESDILHKVFGDLCQTSDSPRNRASSFRQSGRTQPRHQMIPIAGPF